MEQIQDVKKIYFSKSRTEKTFQTNRISIYVYLGVKYESRENENPINRLKYFYSAHSIKMENVDYQVSNHNYNWQANSSVRTFFVSNSMFSFPVD